MKITISNNQIEVVGSITTRKLNKSNGHWHGIRTRPDGSCSWMSADDIVDTLQLVQDCALAANRVPAVGEFDNDN